MRRPATTAVTQQRMKMTNVENQRMNSKIKNIARTLAVTALVAFTSIAGAQESTADYEIKPGDTLIVSVWKEPDLTMEVLVRPDGKFSFPLAGDVQASGKAVEAVRLDLVSKIESYIPDVAATVMLKSIEGNKAYVVGKVLKPGPIIMNSETNVMQALSWAGGTVQFAALKKIVILRGQGGSQTAIPFNYDQVEDGEGLEQNIVLQPGDVVVVP
jgi:polysaccharide export outer membrane protein